jgi:hypothetical protein
MNQDSPPGAPPASSDRLRDLIVASGLSPAEAAQARSVDEKTLLYWCQPNGKMLPPSWAVEMMSRLVAMKRKAKP